MEPETINEILARIAEHPEDAESYQLLGEAYLKAGRMEESHRAYERSLELDPNDPFTHLFLGHWFYHQRRYPEALARFQRAAEFLPDNATAYWCQGDAYVSLGRFDLAHSAYRTAVRVSPEDPKARQKLAEWDDLRKGTRPPTGRMIRAAHANDHAATTVLLAERRLRDHPDDIWVIFDYAEMLYQMTRYDEALRIYLDAIERFPERRWGLYNQLGSMYRYRGDFAIAESWFRKAIDEEPAEAGSYIFLGACQARQGKLQEAEATHRAATGCSEGCIDEAYHNLGLVLRGQGRLAEAAECFRQAIERCPDYANAIEALTDVENALLLSSEIEG
jgi:tetratricopeptide (TPR) repeat protein